MAQHEYTSEGPSWNPAFRPNNLIDQVRLQSEPPVIDPEELLEAPAVEAPVERHDVDDLYTQHSSATDEQTVARPAPEQQIQSSELDQVQSSELEQEQPHVPESEQQHQPREPEVEQSHPSEPEEQQSHEYEPEQQKSHDYEPEQPQHPDPEQQLPAYEIDQIASSHDTAPNQDLPELESEQQPLQEAESQQQPELEPNQEPHEPESEQSVPETDFEQQPHDSALEEPTLEPELEQSPPQPDQVAASPALIPHSSHSLLKNSHLEPPELPVLDDQSTLREVQQDEGVSEQANDLVLDQEVDDQKIGNEYEYQGESTAADDAVLESVKAPLLEDEEIMPTAQELPTPLDLSAGATVDLVQAAGPEVKSEGVGQEDVQVAAEPDFQAEGQSRTEDPQQQSSNFFWDGADDDIDDDTFEALAAQTVSAPPEEELRPNVHRKSVIGDEPVAASRDTVIEEILRETKSNEQPPITVDEVEPPKAQEDELAALWSAALDDDEFLDDSNAVDPSGFFEDDGEGFLDDFDPAQPDLVSPTQPVPVVDAQGQIQGFTTAGHASGQAAGSSDFFSSTAMPSLAAAASPVYGAYGQTPYAAAAQPPNQQQRPAGPQSSQSFVDKAKGGYASPYDLPEDIIKPRNRPARPVAAPVVQPNAPPPRTSSIASAPPHARSPPMASSASPSLPPPSKTVQPQPQPRRSSAASDKKDLSGGFFADLPVVPKPKIRPSASYAPGPTMSGQAPPIRAGTMPPPSGPPSDKMSSQIFGGLQQPARLPLLPDEATPAPIPAPQQLLPPPTAPPASGRYSPAAPPASAARFSPAPPSAPPAAASRYSPAPASQAQNKYAAAPQGARPTLPFAPRTSSPLAGAAEKPHPEVPAAPARSLTYQPTAAPAAAAYQPLATAQPRRASEQADQSPIPLQIARSRSYAPLAPTEGQQNMLMSPPRVSPYAPSLSESPESKKSQPFTPVENTSPYGHFSPPHRPHTQSPGAHMKSPLKTMTQIERPASAAEVPSPTIVRQQDTRQTLHPARRQFSADLSYAMPRDERAADGLERWKGSPILRWSPSGAIITSFPKQAPFYAAGHAIPTIKCTPGSVTIHDSKTSFPMDELNAKFPGPFNLRGKGKKKELVSWLNTKIEDLTKTHGESLLNFDTPQLLKRRAEEKIVLWKMVKVFLEHDNHVEGNTTAESEARSILLPNLSQTEDPADIQEMDDKVQPEPVSASALSQIRKRLLEGKREDAAWYAAEQRLWSHALLIASVGGPDLWKQVVQEFVRAQVKDAGENSQSLAALYEVFAGNWDESIDELVPPSARAGFQMISKTGPSTKNPLDGLDQWRETLGLIISNRSTNDVQAIAALGRLLSKYGRTEAAHTCYLFARPLAKWSGADDSTSDFVLLGVDHQNNAHELAIDIDSILLTEVYEYILSISPTSGVSPVVPHLQAYKLHHAFTLAEHGLRSEAQSYCEAVGTAVKSSTRASPYYHAGLLSQVEDLNRCLSAAPQPSGSSWIPKPSMDKVSGSMWKRFNTFVAGDDDEQGPPGSGTASPGGQAAGPFGQVSGGSPATNVQDSTADIYSAASMYGTPPNPSVLSASAPSKYAPIHAAASRIQPESAGTSRYAPHASNTYEPRASLESMRSDPPERPGTGYSVYTGLQPQPPTQRSSSTPFGAYLPQAIDVQPAQQLGVPRPEAPRAASDYRVQYSQPPSGGESRRESVQSGSVSGYSRRPSIEPSRYSPRPPIEHDQPPFSFQSQHAESPYQPSGPYAPSVPEPVMESIEDTEGQGYEPFSQTKGSLADIQSPISEPRHSSYDPPQSSYEPPSSSYAPPEPSLSDEPESGSSAYQPTSSYEPSSSYEPPSTSYEPPSTSYEPPSTSYEPPSSSYQPYEPEQEPEDQSAETAPPPKKKGIMDLDDDDEDMIARAAALKAQQKRDADRAADEAFRAAAEADAKRDSPSSQTGKKGWFGGWFKKGDGNLDQAQQQGNKPIRAKLGEENSFYYDPDLKKWVNKKGGATPEASSPTPPPPKGPPSRVASGLSAPPMSGPPSRVPSATGGPPMGLGVSSPPSGVSSRAGTPIAPPGPMTPSGVASAVPPGLASGPPSRPPTSMSTASSIDDLLGAPAPRKGGAGTKKGKRGGRYVDVMAK